MYTLIIFSWPCYIGDEHNVPATVALNEETNWSMLHAWNPAVTSQKKHKNCRQNLSASQE
jgi:hypothetical protein